MHINPKLKAEWNKKLKESGFVDIEREDGLFVDRGAWQNNNRPATVDPIIADALQRYYEIASQLVHQDLEEGCLLADVRLSAASQGLIRALHAEGVSNREIEKITNISRYLIGKVVRVFAEQIKQEVTREKAEASKP